MILAQISDSHIESPGVLAYETFDPSASLNAIVDAVNARDPQPDAVIHTGDLVHHSAHEQYPLLRQFLERLKAPVYAIPGNHDSREGISMAFADEPWFPQNGPFIQYTIDDLPLRLVCLDTIFPGEPHGMLCTERLGWLQAQLAAQPDRPTIVACHHPPMATGLTGPLKGGFESGGSEFAAILAQHRQVLRVICGHLHRPMTATFGDRSIWVGPATSYQFEAGTSAAYVLAPTREPPGYSLHLWVDDPASEKALSSIYIPVGDFGARGEMMRR